MFLDCGAKSHGDVGETCKPHTWSHHVANSRVTPQGHLTVKKKKSIPPPPRCVMLLHSAQFNMVLHHWTQVMHKSATALGVDSPSAPQCSPVIQAALTFTHLPSWANQQTSSANLYSTSDLACLSALITHSIRVRLGKRTCGLLRGGVVLRSGLLVSASHPVCVSRHPPFISASAASISYTHWTLTLIYSTAQNQGVKPWNSPTRKSHKGSLQIHLVRCPFTAP